MTRTRMTLTLALTLTAPLPALAEAPQWIDPWPEDGIQRFSAPGYEVTLGENEDLSRSLRINGSLVMTGDMLVLDEAWPLPGGIAVIGTDGVGQRRCAADRFLVWLSEGRHRIDGPISSCSATEITPSGEGLVIRSMPVPAEESFEWVWQPETGFSAPEVSAFRPEYRLDWEDFAPLEDMHPQRLMHYQEVYAPLAADLDQDALRTLVEILDGMGSGVTSGGTYIGEACDPFSCAERFAWIWIDTDTRGVYSLWQEEPGAATWHPAARETWPLWILAEAEQALNRDQEPVGE